MGLDEKCVGRRKTNEMVDVVPQTVMEDCQLTVMDIAKACRISFERDLVLRKLSARWVY